MTKGHCAAWDTRMSSRTEVTLEPCFVLHQKAYRDTSALVEIFSSQYGRVGLVARGVKSSKSKTRGLLQPFTPLLISWGGRGELQTLKAVEARDRAMTLPHRWVMSGFYINELLMRLLMRHDPHPSLFNQYECTLKLLCYMANSEQSPGERLPQERLEGEKVSQLQREHQRVLRLFEKKLLDELGYGLVLDHDVETGTPIEKEKYYQYYLEKGPVLLKTNELKTNELKTNDSDIRETSGFYNQWVEIKGESLLSLAQDQLDDATTLKETKRLMRCVLAGYLGEKPLYSRQLFKHSRPAG